MKSSALTRITTGKSLPPHVSSPAYEVEAARFTNRPTYAGAFRCVGPNCEDSCCGDWDIPLDKSTYERYKAFTPERLGNIVSQFVIISHPPQHNELYGKINRSSSGSCPFFSADRLCNIQKDYGSHLLSASCSIYPRSLSVIAGQLEGSLSLSCPEAARNVLLTTDFMFSASDLYSGEFRTDNYYYLADSPNGSGAKPHSVYLPLRDMLIDIVRDRSRPLWNRLLTIGVLCRALDALDDNQSDVTLLSNLRFLSQMSNSPAVQAEIIVLPSNARLRLEMVFGLTEILMRNESSVRFEDTFMSFVAGVTTPISLSAEGDIERFLQAERTHYKTFFEESPFILENYLVNYMFQNLFPYGRSGSPNFISRGIFAEYLQMTVRFAWVNALLIGVAGQHKGAFTNEHVVNTVQSFTRVLEHYPNLLKSINTYVSKRGLDSLHGMAVMLKH